MKNPKNFGRLSVLSLAAVLAAAGVAVAWLGSRPAASAQSAPAPAAERAQEAAAVKSELRPQVDLYLSLFAQGKVDDMLQRMPLPTGGNRDEFETLRRQLATLYGVAGRYAGFDVVGFQSLSPRYCEVYAIGYFEKQPALFQFGFYRPNNDWQVQHFKLRSDFAQFLEQLPIQRP